MPMSTAAGGAVSDEEEGTWVGRWLCCGRPAFFLPRRHEEQDKNQKNLQDSQPKGKFVEVAGADQDVDGRMAEDTSRLRLDGKPPSPRTLRSWPMSGGVAKCIQHPWGLEEFKKFAEPYYGSPMVNKIDFVRDCLDYKTDGIGTTARVEKAKQIWKLYLSSDVADAVDCIDTDTLKLIRRNGVESGVKDLFDTALGEVLGSPDLSTAFNEFLLSDVVKRASSRQQEPTSGGFSGENNNFR